MLGSIDFYVGEQVRKIGFAFLVVFFLASSYSACAKGEAWEGTVTLSGAWAVYPTAVAWAEAFQKKYPKVRIDVSAGGAGKGAADAIAGLVDIGMVSREPDPAEIQKGIVPIYILRDAVYLVVSDKNPALPALLKKGVQKKTWSGLYITGVTTSWDQVVAGGAGKPVHLYTRSDACGAAAGWAAYLGEKQEDLRGIGVYGDPGLLQAAIRDPVGIGYSNFSYLFTREGTVIAGAKPVPIDANGNGIADPDEVYERRKDAVRAIETGRYPATRKNYFFVKEKPKGLVKEFIQFALSDEGTAVVDQVGTSLPLPKPQREKVLKGLE